MATFTSGISWETDEWFRTFSESFPQYTQPGIWIAAEERLCLASGSQARMGSHYPNRAPEA